MKSASVFSLLVSVGVLTAAVACTKTVTRVVPGTTADAGTDAGKGVTTRPSGDDDDTSGDDDDTTTKKDAGKGDDDDTAGDDDDTAAKPKVSDCKKKALQGDCVSCCQEIEPDGAKVYSAELIKCICLEDNCKTDCKATLCAASPKNPDTACNSCAGTAQQTCGEPVLTACDADAKCKVFNACLNTATCGTKPTQ